MDRLLLIINELVLQLMLLHSTVMIMRVVMGLASQYWVLLVMNAFLSDGPIPARVYS